MTSLGRGQSESHWCEAHHAALHHQAQVSSIVRWLVDMNFPYDWSSKEPAPAFLRDLLAAEWARRDDEDVERVKETLDWEQAWR
jgi:hypothetical protein